MKSVYALGVNRMFGADGSLGRSGPVSAHGPRGLSWLCPLWPVLPFAVPGSLLYLLGFSPFSEFTLAFYLRHKLGWDGLAEWKCKRGAEPSDCWRQKVLPWNRLDWKL